MSHVIIDRRLNSKGKSTDNRRRFVRRVKDQIRESIKEVVRDGSIKDILSPGGKKVSIPGKGLDQPTFEHDQGGTSDRIYPGNKEFIQGDRHDRPRRGQGKGRGRKGGMDGNDDSFEFTLTREEFLEFFFQDLELPDIVKKEIAKLEEFVTRRAGFSVEGSPNRLNIARSMKQAKGRRFALRAPKRKKIKDLEKQLQQLLATDPQTEQCKKQIEELQTQIADLREKIKKVPFLDDVDLRYNRWDKFPVPTTQAVMFGIMDVSGSMGEWEKEMAKRFFMLLLLFLSYNYEKVDIVWIKHHTKADIVDEDDFFYSQESGGTIVSTGLELAMETIKKKYPPSLWNIYFSYISDGEDMSNDIPVACDILGNQLLSVARYGAYIEVDKDGKKDSELWEAFSQIKSTHSNFEMDVISGPEHIYPMFRSLFEKRKKSS